MFMDVRPPKKTNSTTQPAHVAGKSGVTLMSQGKAIHVAPSQVRSVAEKFAKLAKKMGNTNDDEAFANDMEETIYAALQDTEEKQKKSRR